MIKWSALSLVTIGIIHIIVLGMDAVSYVPGWMAFHLWTWEHTKFLAVQKTDVLLSNAAFWSTLGSFAFPTIILGSLLHWMNRRKQYIPIAVGWALFIWSVVCSLVMEPAGFVVGMLISISLLIGLYRQSMSIQ